MRIGPSLIQLKLAERLQALSPGIVFAARIWRIASEAATYGFENLQEVAFPASARNVDGSVAPDVAIGAGGPQRRA